MYDTTRYPNRYKPLDRAVAEFQRNNYGTRYLGASLATIQEQPEVAKQLIGWLDKPEHFLVYIGAPGCGKTYFCAAATEWAYCTFNSFRYFKEADILKRLRLGFDNDYGDWAEELKFMMDDELVIIDDVGSGIDPKKDIQKSIEWRSEVLFTVLDMRYNSMLPTIFTTNLNHKQVREIYSDRACSRLFSGQNTIINAEKSADKRKLGM